MRIMLRPNNVMQLKQTNTKAQSQVIYTFRFFLCFSLSFPFVHHNFFLFSHRNRSLDRHKERMLLILLKWNEYNRCIFGIVWRMRFKCVKSIDG